MRLRSLLFVPANDSRKFSKASLSGADALILDLEDSIAHSEKSVARKWVQNLLKSNPSILALDRQWKLLVRINDLSTDNALLDLDAIMNPGLDGIVLPKCSGRSDIEKFSKFVAKAEETAGIPKDSTAIIALSFETAGVFLDLNSYQNSPARLIAVTWGAEDLRVDIGAKCNRDEQGQLTFPFQLARAQCLLSARAAGIFPIDTVYPDFRDLDGLEKDCRASYRDGYTGRLAIHPDQVGIINRCYFPTDEEINEAKRILKAFAKKPEAGVISFDGKMYDLPHLNAAKQVLKMTGDYST